MDLFSVSADSLFPIASEQNAQREQFAKQYLAQGLQAYTDGKYDQAISLLNSAVGLAPQSDTALNAYQYVAYSYVKQGKTEAAIDTYNKMIKANPTDDTTHTSLANLYYSSNRFDDALKEYERAVTLNPSAANRYSLGQGYLAADQYNNALQQFKMVQQQSPTDPQGFFGIGQSYAKMGNYDAAIQSFSSAIGVKKDYWDAYTELGYAYMDSGNADKAGEIAVQLKGNDDTKSLLLGQYISEH
jgi:pentatricopeptide repeat protein